jgi:adenosine deaminase
MRPLFDLHLHLDGSLRLETMLEIAAEEHVRLPAKDAAGLKKALRCGEIRDDLRDYLKAFDVTVSVMRSRAALERVARELMEDFAAEGGRYAEVRFCPLLNARNGMKPGPRSRWNLTPADVVEAVLKGLREGGRAHGVEWGLILCTLRHLAPRQTEEIALLAKAYQREGVVAIDMAGNDALPVLAKHARHFQWARSHGIGVTLHAGESGPPWEIVEAMRRCGAQRIGHANRALEKPGILDVLLKERIGVEACLTSNVQTRVVESYAEHPARAFLKRGLLVSLNTDNRLLADTTVTKEFGLARDRWKLTDDEAYQLARNAVMTSFTSDQLRMDLLLQLGAS